MAESSDPKSSGSKKSKKSHSGNGCGCFKCFGRLCPCLRASPSPDALHNDLDGCSWAPSVVLDEGSTSLRSSGAGQVLSCDVGVQVKKLSLECLELEDFDDEEQVESGNDPSAAIWIPSVPLFYMSLPPEDFIPGPHHRLRHLFRSSLTSSSPQPSKAVVVHARDSPTSIPDQHYGPWVERVGQAERCHFLYEGAEGAPPKDKRPHTAPPKRSEGGEVSVEDDNRDRPSSAPTAKERAKGLTRASDRALEQPGLA